MFSAVWFSKKKSKERKAELATIEDLYRWAAERLHRNQLGSAWRTGQDMWDSEVISFGRADDDGTYPCFKDTTLDPKELEKVCRRVSYPTVDWGKVEAERGY